MRKIEREREIERIERERGLRKIEREGRRGERKITGKKKKKKLLTAGRWRSGSAAWRWLYRRRGNSNMFRKRAVEKEEGPWDLEWAPVEAEQVLEEAATEEVVGWWQCQN